MAKATKKAGEPVEGLVIQNITIRPVVRRSQDIQAWRSAIMAAEAIHSIRQPLYDLYEEILLDGVLASLVEKRVLGATKTRMLFVDGAGKEVEAITDLTRLRQWRELRKEVMRSKVFGLSVVELIREGDHFRIYAVPRKHIRPVEGLVTYEQWGTEGLSYRTPPYRDYILEVGGPRDFGLLMKAAQYVIYKRGAFGDWAHFAEIFGIPFREARYSGHNREARLQLEQALDSIGSAGYAILPDEASLTFHESKSPAGSAELFSMLRKACNEELSILLLGQTETTAKTAGKLGGNDATHEKTEDDINADDRADELAIFNEQVKPILQRLGYPVEGGSFIYEKQEESLALKDRVDIVLKLRNEGALPVDDEYLYEISGIPKPPDYAERKAKGDGGEKGEKGDGGEKGEKGKEGGKPQKEKEGDAEEKLAWIDRFRLSMADFFDPAPKS